MLKRILLVALPVGLIALFIAVMLSAAYQASAWE